MLRKCLEELIDNDDYDVDNNKKKYIKHKTTHNFVEQDYHTKTLIQYFIVEYFLFKQSLKYKLNNSIYTISKPKLKKKEFLKLKKKENIRKNKIPKLNSKNINTINQNIFLN